VAPRAGGRMSVGQPRLPSPPKAVVRAGHSHDRAISCLTGN
jgi:hypothetical protein